jgi:hypothetical protein
MVPRSSDRGTIPGLMTGNRAPGSPVSIPAADPVGAPAHACMRCGAPVAEAAAALCDECNPLGLAQPSATQVHGIAFLGVAIAVIVMAVVGRVALGGVGPFEGRVAAAMAQGTALEVTLSVTNRGTSAGATTCTVTDPGARYGGAVGYVQSPRIGPGETVTFTGEVTELGTAPGGLAVSCSHP